MDHETKVPAGGEAADVARVLARAWPLVLGTVILLVALLVFLPLAFADHTATARVVVRLLPPLTDETSLNMVTEAQVAGSPEVAERAAETLEGVSADELLESTSIEPVLSSEILKITSSASSPSSAEDAANALARAYLDARRERGSEILDAKLDALVGREQRTQSQLEGAGEGKVGRSRSRVLFRNLESIRDRIAEVRGISASVSGGELIEPARAQTAVGPSSIVRNAFIGLVLGLGLGSGLALLLEAIRGRVRASSQIESIASAPVLAEIGGTDGDAEPQHALGRLAVLVDAATGAENIRSLLITYADRDAERVDVSAHLAQGLARLGRRILSVDVTDPSSPGFVDLLIEQGSPAGDLPGAPGVGNVTVLPAGAQQEAAVRAFASEKTTTTLTSLSARFDMTVLDAGRFESSQLPILLASRTDRVLLVVTRGSHRSLLANQMKALRRVGATVLGLVLVEGPKADR